MLRRVLGQQRKCVRAEVIDGAGEADARAGGSGGGDGVLQHRQRQRPPVPIARRVDAMHDQRGTCGRRDDVGALHGVAANPFHAHNGTADFRRVAVQRPHLPAPSHGTADPAGRAQDQCRLHLNHRIFPLPTCCDGEGEPADR